MQKQITRPAIQCAGKPATGANPQGTTNRSRLDTGTVKRAAVPMGNHNGEMDRLFAQWDQL